jgi:hypothetical protein
MAALTDSSLYTAQAAALLDGSERPNRTGTTGGTVKVLRGTYTTTGDEATNDTFNLCYLPKGASPLRGLSSVTCVDPGTALTLDIGTSANPDIYADGIVLSAGGTISFGSTVAGTAGDLAPTVTTDNSVVIVKLASADTVTASVVLYFTVAYIDWN